MSRSDVPVILATGGAGFIGSHIVVELLNNGFNVVVIDNFVNALKGELITYFCQSTVLKFTLLSFQPNPFCHQGQDGGPKPESLRRVEKITNKTVTFYDVDLLDVAALRNVFSKVINASFSVFLSLEYFCFE